MKITVIQNPEWFLQVMFKNYNAMTRSNSNSRSTSTLLIVLLIIFTFPFWIGIAGGLFGLVAGLFGAAIGIIVGVFGAIIGAIGAVIGGIFGGWGYGSSHVGINTFLAIALVVAIVMLSKARRERK